MSYEKMDHAGWVERNNAAARRMTKPSRGGGGRAKGPHAAPEKLTPFQARFMDILGIVGGGIYNAPIAWDRVDWNAGEGVAVPWNHGHFATFDYANLTKLVFLAHEARIRIELRPHGRGLLIAGWPRSHAGEGTERHPNLDEAVAAFRAAISGDHRIFYSPATDDPLPARRRHLLEWLAGEGGVDADALRVATCIEAGERVAAENLAKYLRRRADEAAEVATYLGGGEDVAEMAAKVLAVADTAAAMVDAMPPLATAA